MSQKQSIDIAISPCPNDSAIFYQMSRPGFSTFELDFHFADVEKLNRRAIEEARHHVTKLSFAAIFELDESYRLLQSGGALGYGCGPLLLAAADHEPLGNSEATLRRIAARGEKIAIPGRWTTAALLLRLYLKELGLSMELVELRYEQILPQLGQKRDDSTTAGAGVLIHEERFTYEASGAHKLIDLGEWWEERTGLPIPLGGICVRRSLGEKVATTLEEEIRRSLLATRENPEPALPFIRSHAQALDDVVIHSHIELYVNDHSLDFGSEGRAAIERLRQEARKA